MNTIEIEQATAYILEMFPSTDVTSRGMVTLWGKQFAHIQLQDAKDAIDAHREESLYASVKIAEFRKHVQVIVGRRLNEQRRAERRDTPIPEQYCGMFIECTKPPKAYPHRTGLQKPLIRGLQAHPSRDEIRQAAESMVKREQKVYGPSDWRIVDDPDGRIYYSLAWLIFNGEKAADELQADLDGFRQQENENMENENE